MINNFNCHSVMLEDVNVTGNGQLVLDSSAIIEPNVLIDLGVQGTVKIGYRSKIKYGSVLKSYDGVIEIGNRTTIGEYTILAGHGGILIGNEVIVSGHCYFSSSNHIFSSNEPIRFQGETAQGIIISDNVWIGAHCTILDNVSIETGCVIGAGSVVTKRINRDMVCFGNPCREIYKRTNK